MMFNTKLLPNSKILCLNIKKCTLLVKNESGSKWPQEMEQQMSMQRDIYPEKFLFRKCRECGREP